MTCAFIKWKLGSLSVGGGKWGISLINQERGLMDKFIPLLSLRTYHSEGLSWVLQETLQSSVTWE